MNLYLITDDSPNESVAQLTNACAAHRVTLHELDAQRFDPLDFDPLPAGALLYRVGTTHASIIAEQTLYRPDLATFYSNPLGPFLIHDTQPLLLARSGVPVPRATHVLHSSRERLRAQVEQLGGFPLVLKIPGHSLGIGVVRLTTLSALFAVADLVATTHGTHATLMACIEPAVHWRVIVVGTQVVSAYISPVEPDDFRTFVDESSIENFTSPAPEAVTQAALLAVAALELEFAGVDVLCDEQGEVYVLEANFPCYFAHPLRAAKIDVASAMVAYLVAKSALIYESSLALS